MKRQRLYRPKIRDSKTKEVLKMREATIVCVRDWWHRVNESKQLYFRPEFVRERVDYIGTLPWPDKASFISLYRDFMSEYGDKALCSASTFAYYLHEITPLMAGESKRTRLSLPNGELYLYVSRTFIDIPR